MLSGSGSRVYNSEFFSGLTVLVSELKRLTAQDLAGYQASHDSSLTCWSGRKVGKRIAKESLYVAFSCASSSSSCYEH